MVRDTLGQPVREWRAACTARRYFESAYLCVNGGRHARHGVQCDFVSAISLPARERSAACTARRYFESACVAHLMSLMGR